MRSPPDNDEGRPGKGGPVTITTEEITDKGSSSVSESAVMAWRRDRARARRAAAALHGGNAADQPETTTFVCLCPDGADCTIIRQHTGGPPHLKKWRDLAAVAIEQVRDNPEAFPPGHPVRVRFEEAGVL